MPGILHHSAAVVRALERGSRKALLRTPKPRCSVRSVEEVEESWNHGNHGHPLLFTTFTTFFHSSTFGHPLFFGKPGSVGKRRQPLFFAVCLLTTAWKKRGHPLFLGYLLGVVRKGLKTPLKSVFFPCRDTQSPQKRLQSTGKGTSGIRGGQLSFVEPDDQKVRFCGNQQV